MNRKEKIKFLKGLAMGSRSVREILPGNHITEFFHRKGELYVNDQTGEKFSSKLEFKNRHQGKPFPRNTTIHTIIFADFSGTSNREV